MGKTYGFSARTLFLKKFSFSHLQYFPAWEKRFARLKIVLGTDSTFRNNFFFKTTAFFDVSSQGKGFSSLVGFHSSIFQHCNIDTIV